MFLEKEKEIEKVKESHQKEKEKDSLDRLKLEDTVRNLVLENQRLKSKDDAYFNIFDCLNQFLDSKGFKISKVGEVKDNNGNKNRNDQNPPKDASREKNEHEQGLSSNLVTFLCDKCDFETNSKKELESHNTNVHIRAYQCKFCEYKTNSEDDLKEHEKNSHKKTVLSCIACQFKTNSKDELQKHIDDTHDSIEVVQEQSDEDLEKPDSVYQCIHCKFHSENKKSMKDHLEKDHRPKETLGSYKCSECAYIGVKKDSLEQHIRMKHANKSKVTTTKYICDFCDFETSMETNLRKHETDIHSRTKPKESCNMRQKENSISTEREEHIKDDHHQPKSISCDLCRFVSKDHYELDRHLEIMHGFMRVNNKKNSISNGERNIPQCYYDGYCRNSNCRFFHSKPSSFLGRRSLFNQPPQRYFGGPQQSQRQRR